MVTITEVSGLAIDDPALTPNLLAEKCAALIADLEAQKAKAKRAERKSLNRRLHSARVLLGWAKSRAGYR